MGKGQKGGRVYQAIHEPTQKKFAAKVIRKEEENLERIRSEFKAFCALPKHSNIIDCAEIVQSNTNMFFFLELADLNLTSYLESSGGRLDFGQAHHLFSQMLAAVEHCHAHRVCHHDLKLDNFVLIKPGFVKLIDFGFARKYEMGQNIDHSSCSPAYAPLNVLEGKPHSPVKSDVFGLGVCWYLMTYGKLPFCDPRKDSWQSLVLRLRSQLPPSFPPRAAVPEGFVKILRGMLAFDEQKRFNLNKVSELFAELPPVSD
eukprot:TRINITY_DN10809_c0_g1_i1.p1 TRINITY_DN10809_c0_g1~~TRINITY_DN10809_c0_g1_i1.p1  ORF type:complete len:287 (+),score=48.13 TRINITY_DN10809_c0_g1_i1:89-862(+)